MSAMWRTALITALVAFATALLGVYAGLAWFSQPRRHSSLDIIVHRELNLDSGQDALLEDVEARFAVRRSELEGEMRAAAREIANAIADDKAYTEHVRSALERFHSASGELQHETIVHVFEMRATLSPQQRERFDEIVRAELLKAIEGAAD